MKALLTINEKIIDVTSSKTVFFPLNYFLNKIVREDTCFVCGAERGSKDFDDEHIIPKWVLRNFNLQERRITLLNKKSFIYSKYKIPCCKDCNKELGQAYEESLSHKLKLKYNDLEKNVDDNFKKLLFKWMSLIFIKTHLKDKEVRFDEDRGITLAIETLENKDILFSKLGLFFLLATNIEKILAEYIFEKTKNDSFRDSPLGVKEKEFNKVVVSYTDERYRNITSKLADFRKRRNDITHKTIIVDPKYFSNIFYINWRNQEMSDEISSDEYVKYLDTSIDIGRNLLADLVTLFLYEDLEEKKFIEARELTTKMPFGFHNKHC